MIPGISWKISWWVRYASIFGWEPPMSIRNEEPTGEREVRFVYRDEAHLPLGVDEIVTFTNTGVAAGNERALAPPRLVEVLLAAGQRLSEGRGWNQGRSGRSWRQ